MIPIAREDPPSSLLPVDPRLSLGDVELLIQEDADGLLLFVVEVDTEGVGEVVILLNSPGEADQLGLINGLAEGVCKGDNIKVDGDDVGLSEGSKGLLRGLLEHGVVLGVMGRLPLFSLGDGVNDEDGLTRAGEGVGETDVAGGEVMKEVGDEVGKVQVVGEDETLLVRAGEADVEIATVARGLTEGVC